MLNRRLFLGAGGLAVGAAIATPLLTSGALPAWAAPPTRAVITPFARPMPVAPVLAPVSRAGGVDVYRLPITAATAEILPGVQTPVLTYGGTFIGPTIRARAGRPVEITFSNALAEAANVHLHGGRTAAEHDGYPMDVIEPGASRFYRYDNAQPGATLWYHDHAHHSEAEHCYRGMHGAYVVEDPAERTLGLPGGAQDVPILLRDIEFGPDNELIFSDPANRTTVLANGIPQPYFRVAARKYRFRLVNGANERVFRLGLAGRTFTQIASDGGLLPAPVPLTELVLASAERADIVVDFSADRPGTRLVLADANLGPVLRFDVTRRAADTSRVPAVLRPLPAMPAATTTRDVDLAFDLTGHPIGLVNGMPFDPDRIDFRIGRGTTEIWTITSTDPPGIAHTFHMHLTQFRVLDRDGGPIRPEDAGLKDTVHLNAGETLRVQATFADHLGKYVYHCHFPEHSVLGMMAQMEVVA